MGCEVVCWAEPYLLDSGIRLERKLSGSYYLLGWATPNRVTIIIVVVVISIPSCVLVGVGSEMSDVPVTSVTHSFIA